MGQYYVAMTIDDETGEGTIYHPHRCGCGMKLMEFAYIGTPFADGITGLLEKGAPFHLLEDEYRPKRLAIIGDYADPDEYDDEGYSLAVRIAHTGLCERMTADVPMCHGVEGRGMWAFDLDLRERVALHGLPPADKDCADWHINPLMLLCAVGNQGAGGDYRGTSMDMVGRWAFHRIMVCSEQHFKWEKVDPSEFDIIEPGFQEGGA